MFVMFSFQNVSPFVLRLHVLLYMQGGTIKPTNGRKCFHEFYQISGNFVTMTYDKLYNTTEKCHIQHQEFTCYQINK